MLLQRIDTRMMLEEKLADAEEINLYGAGFYLKTFLREIGNDFRGKIKYIMVSDSAMNPADVGGIPVISYVEADLKPTDVVFLTLGERFTMEIYELLKGYGCTIFSIDFNLFQVGPYLDIKNMVQPFIDSFPNNTLSLNQPVETDRKVAWTCWWQGESSAPEVVKICLESQRKNLPHDVEHIVITQENYGEYIRVPQYIIDKMNKGYISLTHFSEIIRTSLLYKWGGFWLDATVLVLEQLDSKIMDYPIYTRNIPEKHFCADTVWAFWFLYAKKGSKLFFFLLEGLCYYLSQYDRIKYYYTIDYLTAIACDKFPDILEQLHNVPYNNDRAQELGRHLAETYDREKFQNYTQDTYLQKLTYKQDWEEAGNREDSIYSYIRNCYLGNENAQTVE